MEKQYYQKVLVVMCVYNYPLWIKCRHPQNPLRETKYAKVYAER